MMKKVLLMLMTFGLFVVTNAQTTEEMQAQKAAKEAQLATLKPELKEISGKVEALEADVAKLTDKLTPYPRWSTGSFGTIGFSLANFNDWLSKDLRSTSAATIGLTLNGFANLDQKKYFWRNGANLNLSWLKFDDKNNPDDEDGFQIAADAFNITSLFGYKVSPHWAISGLGEYRTSILGGKFNNPGFLDLGVGATWTPIQNLVVVIHPLNYNFVFSDEEFNYISSLGAKIVADYTSKLTKSITWKSNFSTFLSYEDVNHLSNFTWVNTLTTAYKGVGIAFDLGLRGNKQEAFNILNDNDAVTEVKDYKGDNPLQTYWVLGLSYNIGG